MACMSHCNDVSNSSQSLPEVIVIIFLTNAFERENPLRNLENHIGIWQFSLRKSKNHERIYIVIYQVYSYLSKQNACRKTNDWDGIFLLSGKAMILRQSVFP